MASYERKDHLHQRAKREGFRSRAAYKLEEIQRGHRLLRPGQRVLDIGCWPGGWLQVAARAVGRGGRVVGIDLTETNPLEYENVIALTGDFTGAQGRAALLEALGSAADVVLSDAAPKLTGVRATDRAREEVLLESLETALADLLRPGGDLLLKILEGPEAQAVDRRLRRRFARAKGVRLRASRRGSSERYLLGRSFEG